MDGSTRHISVTVPSMNMNSPRIAITRQSLQTSLNRSIPAQGQGVEDFPKYNPHPRKNRAPSPRLVRTAPTGTHGAAATNEFVGRTRTGPNRQPAKTNIIDFDGIPLHPRQRQNVRGIDGFFPPLRMKSGSGSGKFVVSESIGITTAWGPKSGQDPDSASATSSQQQFHVELAPQPHSDLGPESVPLGQPSTDWLQRRNKDILSTNNSFLHGHNDHAQPSPKVPRRSRSPPAPEVTGLTHQQRKKDAAWVRAFKVKQHRNNRYKDMDMSSKSMTTLEDGTTRWGLPSD